VLTLVLAQGGLGATHSGDLLQPFGLSGVFSFQGVAERGQIGVGFLAGGQGRVGGVASDVLRHLNAGFHTSLGEVLARQVDAEGLGLITVEGAARAGQAFEGDGGAQGHVGAVGDHQAGDGARAVGDLVPRLGRTASGGAWSEGSRRPSSPVGQGRVEPGDPLLEHQAREEAPLGVGVAELDHHQQTGAAL